MNHVSMCISRHSGINDGHPLRMCAIVHMDCWQRRQEADTLYLHL